MLLWVFGEEVLVVFFAFVEDFESLFFVRLAVENSTFINPVDKVVYSIEPPDDGFSNEDGFAFDLNVNGIAVEEKVASNGVRGINGKSADDKPGASANRNFFGIFETASSILVAKIPDNHTVADDLQPLERKECFNFNGQFDGFARFT